jgi:YD repeat-containing protein
VGTGLGARTTALGYDPDGYLESITDPLSRLWSYGRDAAGRVTSITRPDTEVIGLGYDENGNLESVTPPGRPPHVFGYSPVDQMQSYSPPEVDGVSMPVGYSHDIDRDLDVVTRADGSTLDFDYNPTTGRLTAITWPLGVTTLGYDPSTGQLASLDAPDGESLTFAYDGALPTDVTWSGSVAGTVGRDYDPDLRISSLTVASGATTETWSYGFDLDGLLEAAGDLSVTRDPVNGLVTTTTLGGPVE